MAELYLSSELESYLEWHERDYRGQETDLRKQLERHYDPAKAQAMAREFMMYDS